MIPKEPTYQGWEPSRVWTHYILLLPHTRKNLKGFGSCKPCEESMIAFSLKTKSIKEGIIAFMS